MMLFSRLRSALRVLILMLVCAVVVWAGVSVLRRLPDDQVVQVLFVVLTLIMALCVISAIAVLRQARQSGQTRLSMPVQVQLQLCPLPDSGCDQHLLDWLQARLSDTPLPDDHPLAHYRTRIHRHTVQLMPLN